MDATFECVTYNYCMKTKHALVFVLTLLLFACQPSTLQTVTVIDNGSIIALQSSERVSAAILSEAGIPLDSSDTVLLDGLVVSPDTSITSYPATLQIRRAGETAETPEIQQPSVVLNLTSNGKILQIESSAATIGAALAEAGIPLMGADYSIPSENEPLPGDGNIKVVRISESVLLAQKPIPFTSELIQSADVPLDQTQILQPGETGLTIQRIRVRYEDGAEVARITEDETVVRPPKNRVLGYGTKIEIKTAVVDGVTIEYWRAVQMYITSYSPCRSGGDRCYPGTSSGATVKRGVVGMRYDWYLSMGGQPLYIPGYGFATVEDVCGGCVGRPWIDVAYSDNDYVPWSSWVTVYFLTPVPPNIVYVLE